MTPLPWKMTSKFRVAFLYVSSAWKTLNLLEIAKQFERKYCFSSNISFLQTSSRNNLVYSREFVVAMVTN